MFDENNTGVDEMEFAEPSEEVTEDLGEEVQTVAESDSERAESAEEKHKRTPDEAFAEMRRAREEAEREAREAREELESLKAEQEARQRALDRLSGGKENAELEALADSLGLEVEDVIATLQAEQAQASIQAENERLKQQLADVETERRLDNVLTELKGIDPNLTEEETMKVLEYADKGLSVEDGYYAVKAKEINTRATPPREIGKIGETKPLEKEFFTEAEIEAMSSDELKKNWKKVLASWERYSS